MPVTEGVLTRLGSSSVISGAGTGLRVEGDTVRRTGVDIQRGWVQFQLVDIGDTQLKNVMTSPLHADMLEEALGEPVAISWHGPDVNSGRRHTVVAVRTPKRGVDKSPGLMFVSIVWLVRYAIAALAMGAVIGILSQIFFNTFLPGIVFAILWVLWGWSTISKMNAAAGALGKSRRN
jgi:hypothetical protein